MYTLQLSAISTHLLDENAVSYCMFNTHYRGFDCGMQKWSTVVLPLSHVSLSFISVLFHYFIPPLFSFSLYLISSVVCYGGRYIFSISASALLWDVTSGRSSSLTSHAVVAVTHQCFPLSWQRERVIGGEGREGKGSRDARWKFQRREMEGMRRVWRRWCGWGGEESSMKAA